LRERALAIREKVHGPDHVDVVRPLMELGALRTHRGEPALALPLLERALALREKAVGPDQAETAEERSARAECRLALGRAREAVGEEERAWAALSEPGALAGARFVLARALRAARGDEVRARQLAEQARDYFAGAGAGRADELRQVTSWLGKR